ncbi:MAG: hypothetical protein JWQ09_356 [Segetibacter sp.]|nr:hypothetical protein [Segetibacter sp.]
MESCKLAVSGTVISPKIVFQRSNEERNFRDGTCQNEELQRTDQGLRMMLKLPHS